MHVATEGIVLHYIKYGESSVIATIFTREFGRQTYIVNAIRRQKSKNKAGMLQPLFLVELEAYQKKTRDIQRIKTIKSKQVYQNIPYDITKSTQALFLAELLYKTIREQESYVELFDFIKHNLLYFDLMEDHFSNFHLYFLLRLTEYLGFMPDTSKIGFEGWFDMRKGAIVPFEPSHPMFANKEVTEYFIKLSYLTLNNLGELTISRSMRDALLNVLIDYYHQHFDHLGEIKSSKVLKEIFS